MNAPRPLHRRVAIWIGTAVATWALFLVGRSVLPNAEPAEDGVKDGSAVQQITCTPDQMGPDGRCNC